MDNIDLKILDSLTRNARKRASDVSKEIGLSVSAVIERIKKLEDSGVVRTYTPVVDQKRLGNDLAAWVEVSLEHPKYYDGFVAQVQQMHNVTACHYITGDFDFVLHVISRSSEALEAVHRRIKEITGVAATQTHFVLKTVKETHCLLPENADDLKNV